MNPKRVIKEIQSDVGSYLVQIDVFATGTVTMVRKAGTDLFTTHVSACELSVDSAMDRAAEMWLDLCSTVLLDNFDETSRRMQIVNDWLGRSYVELGWMTLAGLAWFVYLDIATQRKMSIASVSEHVYVVIC